MISPLWREWESGNSIPLSVLRFFVLLGGLLFLSLTGVMGLPWPQQAVVALLTIAVAVWLDRSSSSYLVTLTLMLLSVYSTFRYGFWRIATTVGTLRQPGAHWGIPETILMGLLLLAEFYAFMTLLLGYMQMVWPLRRMPVPLPDATYDWPAVDVLIPTLHEPLEVVRFTALAALNMDWPAEKLNVFILDDGGRREFRDFADEAGVGYMTRDDQRAGKAGNLNAALEQTESPFVVVFDADHVPTRSFLQVTMGWFLRDAQLGILQTPHHFYSPNPFERNLGHNRSVPGEDELFYGVVQDGNDFWNATYFCGSCAVLRRRALNEVGGMATETVAEDAHTSMRMQRVGWNSAYINIPQAAGLATETLSAHVRQRTRWARGMVQILRIENPLFGRGLDAAQRLCYFNSMAHFLYALPRLIFLTAPLLYLVFGYTILPGYWAAILAYAAPHLVLSSVARSRMEGSHRHSFWTEIYETVLAPYVLGPTLAALINPRGARPEVTATAETVDQEHFDSRIARPTLALLVLNWAGLFCGAARLMPFPSWQVPGWASFVNWPSTLYERGHTGPLAIHMIWTVFNLVLLGVAAAVAWESLQRRRSVRVETTVPSEVLLADGSKVRGVTADLSSGGVRTRMEFDVQAKPGDAVRFVFAVPNGTAVLPALVVALEGRVLRAKFDRLTLPELEALTIILYGRADRWLGWSQGREPDRPVRSFLRILRLAGRGLRQAFFGGRASTAEDGVRRRWETSAVPMLALALLCVGRGYGAEVSGAPHTGKAIAGAASGLHGKSVPGEFRSVLTLADLGQPEKIALSGLNPRQTVAFAVPQSVLVHTATLRLRYRFFPESVPALSQLKVSLNGTLIATLPVPAEPKPAEDRTAAFGSGAYLSAERKGDQGRPLESVIPLPLELLGRSNSLGFELGAQHAAQCGDPAHAGLWTEVNADSALELTGTTVPLDDELGLLPLPFYQAGISTGAEVPVVFLGTPTTKAMQAAAIVASWFGEQAGARLDGAPAVRFPVTLGRIPQGNVVVIGQGGALPAALRMGQVSGATVAMRTNPVDPLGKVLLLTGMSGDDLLHAATAIAVQTKTLRGAQVTLSNVEVPAERGFDDAPRWLSTDHVSHFGAADTANLGGEGTKAAVVSLELPPDLFYGDGPGGMYGEGVRTLPLHLRYRYNGLAAGQGSTLQVWVNGVEVSRVGLLHSDRTATLGEAEVAVPVERLRPFSNTLELRFATPPGGCAAAVPPSLAGTISKDSYLDVQGLHHWTALPNLALFGAAGYPFTRRADLADTAVVLPPEPTRDELQLFLTIMAHFGAQTGYPVLRVTVTGPEGMTLKGGRDYLVLGTSEDQPALRITADQMPVGVDETGMHLHQPRAAYELSTWWRARRRGTGVDNDFETAGGMPDGLIEAMEWPRGSRRSVVTVVARNESALRGLVAGFSAGANSALPGQTVSALRGGAWRSYRMDGTTYMSGSLPAELKAKLLLARFPWLIVLVSVMVCLLVASLLRGILRREARRRLQGSS